MWHWRGLTVLTYLQNKLTSAQMISSPTAISTSPAVLHVDRFLSAINSTTFLMRSTYDDTGWESLSTTRIIYTHTHTVMLTALTISHYSSLHALTALWEYRCTSTCTSYNLSFIIICHSLSMYVYEENVTWLHITVTLRVI